MFHVLHRVYVLSWVVLSLGLVVWLYPRTGISEPLLDGYAVWQNGPAPAVQPAAELSGMVLRVIDGTSFTLRSASREVYTVGLLGVAGPVRLAKPTAAEVESAQRAQNFLSGLILSNEVQVMATWLDPQRRAVGIVHLGETNINAAMIEAGMQHLKKEHIKGLPWRDQYALFRAERKAREAKGAVTP
jgi:endonuclease YncB( thermonuclease family)